IASRLRRRDRSRRRPRLSRAIGGWGSCCSTASDGRVPRMFAIPVTPLPATGGRDWDALARAFRGKPILELGQSWIESPEPLLSRGQVRVGISGMSLAVFATLRDRDVFNPVEHFNVPAFPHGDVIEIFLQPEGQE